MENQTNQPPTKDTDDESSKIFPQRLMEILNEPSNHDTVIWLPHGKAFLIIDRQKFSTEVLPKYFRKTKYVSFARKLNRWNFSRVTQGSEFGAYYHEFFQKGNEALCIQMYCKNKRFKYATSQDECTANIQSNDHLTNSSSSMTISDAQQSSNIETQSLVSKIHAQVSQITPAQGQVQPSRMPSLILLKMLAPTMIDPTLRIRALITRQQTQIRQEQLKLSLINMSNPLLTSQLYPQPYPMNQEQMLQKVAFIEMKLEAIRMRIKQDQLQTRPQKRSLIRQTSASAA